MNIFDGLFSRERESARTPETSLPTVNEIREFFADREQDEEQSELEPPAIISDDEAKDIQAMLRQNRGRKNLLAALKNDNDVREAEHLQKQEAAKDLAKKLKDLAKNDEFIFAVRERLRLDGTMLYLGDVLKTYDEFGIIAYSSSVILSSKGFQTAINCGYFPDRDRFERASLHSVKPEHLIEAGLTLSRIYTELERYIQKELDVEGGG